MLGQRGISQRDSPSSRRSLRRLPLRSMTIYKATGKWRGEFLLTGRLGPGANIPSEAWGLIRLARIRYDAQKAILIIGGQAT
jgi:hypothetical protein